MNPKIATLVMSVLLVSACSAEPAPAPEPEEKTPVAETTPTVDAPDLLVSNSILGSVVGDILTCAVGDTASLEVLMPLGTDPHDFQPSSAQVAAIVSADLVVVNGLGLEEGLEGALEGALSDGGSVFVATDVVDPIVWSSVELDDAHDDHGHEEDEFDPHFWMDMSRMAVVAKEVGARLARDTGDDVFADCGLEVATTIEAAEGDVIALLEAVPQERRLLVTDHEALGYFAERYGFTIAGVIIPGGSTMGAPDSRELAALVDVIQSMDVPAIFGNQSLNPAVLEALAEEAGRDVAVVPLFVESLGSPDSGADTYAGMMMTNASRIAQALQD